MGKLRVGGGYRSVERYINAPFTSPGSSRAWDRRGLPLLSQALPSVTSQRRSALEGLL